MNFELWYPTLKSFTLPAVASYFCIDIFRYAFGLIYKKTFFNHLKFAHESCSFNNFWWFR